MIQPQMIAPFMPYNLGLPFHGGVPRFGTY
jgi:hypothetical protein